MCPEVSAVCPLRITPQHTKQQEEPVMWFAIDVCAVKKFLLPKMVTWRFSSFFENILTLRLKIFPE